MGATGLKLIIENFLIKKSDGTTYLISALSTNINLVSNDVLNHSNIILNIPNFIYGNVSVIIQIDPDNSLIEISKSNNIQKVDISLARYYSDFELYGISIKNGPDFLNISWSVRNKGNLAVDNRLWTDSVYLSLNGLLDSRSFKLEDIIISQSLDVSESYSFSAKIENSRLKSFYGKLISIFVVTDSNFVIESEINRINNMANATYLVTFSLLPDLSVKYFNCFTNEKLFANSRYVFINFFKEIKFLFLITFEIKYAIKNLRSPISQKYSFMDPVKIIKSKNIECFTKS